MSPRQARMNAHVAAFFALFRGHQRQSPDSTRTVTAMKFERARAQARAKHGRVLHCDELVERVDHTPMKGTQ